MRGKFLTLEGIDGAGKSTQLEWVATLLRKQGHKVVVTREPGGTPLGERLRELLLSPGQQMNPDTEVLLMFADRREHVARVIAPALERGEWVVCDRFTDATFAYQGGGRGVDWARLKQLESWALGGLEPDLTLLFDLAPAAARKRLKTVRDPDRFEQERAAFFERVREAYQRRAREAGSRIVVIDGAQSPPDVKKAVEKIITTYCTK